MYVYSLNRVREYTYRQYYLNFSNFNSISMKQYAVIHAVAGLFEGYSDTTCEFFPNRGSQRNIKQIIENYRKAMRCA